MSKRKTIITLCILGVVAMGLMAVQSKSKKNTSAETEEKKEKEKPVLHVEATEATSRDIRTYIESTGTLKSYRQVDIMSKALGQVVQLNVEEGSLVKEGDILIQLDAKDATLELEQAQITHKKAEREFKRAKKLYQQSLVTQEEYEMKAYDLEKSESDLKMSQRKLEQMQVMAPFDGIITNRSCEIGQNISTADKLFTIAQVSTLKADVFLPEHQSGYLAENQKVILSRDNRFEETIEGSIERLSPVIDAATGTLKITVTLSPIEASWRPGSYVHLRIVTGEHQDALVLPRKALVFNNQQETSVFLIETQDDESEVVKQVTVKTGPEERGFISIQSGLKKGDRVVLTGKESLKEGDKVTTS